MVTYDFGTVPDVSDECISVTQPIYNAAIDRTYD